MAWNITHANTTTTTTIILAHILLILCQFLLVQIGTDGELGQTLGAKRGTRTEWNEDADELTAVG